MMGRWEKENYREWVVQRDRERQCFGAEIEWAWPPTACLRRGRPNAVSSGLLCSSANTGPSSPSSIAKPGTLPPVTLPPLGE